MKDQKHLFTSKFSANFLYTVVVLVDVDDLQNSALQLVKSVTPMTLSMFDCVVKFAYFFASFYDTAIEVNIA